MPRPKRSPINPRNRPQIPIDWNMVDKYLSSGCIGTEIAAIVGCHPTTLYERCLIEKGVNFTSYAAEKRSKGDGLLRDKQYVEAMKGDRGMLIWLGKQRLGQKESHDVAPPNDKQIDELIEHLKSLKSGAIDVNRGK